MRRRLYYGILEEKERTQYYKYSIEKELATAVEKRYFSILLGEKGRKRKRSRRGE